MTRSLIAEAPMMDARVTTGVGLLFFLMASVADAQTAADRLARSVEELRLVVGRWSVSTQDLRDDGTVARTVRGTYEFEWIVPDRVVQGRSDVPDLQRSSGILFYVSETQAKIEMVSVGADGQLWVMTGPLGGDTRQTPIIKLPDGASQQLRFTRFNVAPDGFESRMERSTDGGKTWTPGNRQVFERQPG